MDAMLEDRWDAQTPENNPGLRKIGAHNQGGIRLAHEETRAVAWPG